MCIAESALTNRTLLPTAIWIVFGLTPVLVIVMVGTFGDGSVGAPPLDDPVHPGTNSSASRPKGRS
jgi:hypothetical protein